MKDRYMFPASFPCLLLALVVLVGIPASSRSQGGADYIHYQLGVRYKNERKFDQSMEEFRRVLAAYPDNFNAYMHLAEIRLEQGDYRLAVFNLQRALQHNPGWGKAHRLLAAAYEHDGQYERAIMELQQFQQTGDPALRDSVQQHIEVLLARTRGEKPPAAREPGDRGAAAMEQAPSRKPPRIKPVPSRDGQVEELFQSAVQAYGAGNYENALALIRNVLTAQPGHPGAYYYAGLIRRRYGQNDMARINFERALAYPQLGYNAHFYLGRIHGDQHQYAQAIEHLESYMQLTSYEPGEREARALITRYRNALTAARQASKAQQEQRDQPVALALDLDMEREVQHRVLAPIEITLDSLLTMLVIDTLTDAGQRLLAGVHEFRKNNFDAAIRELRKVLVEYPSGAIASHALYNIGICYYRLHLFSEAENQFEQVVSRFGGTEPAVRSELFRALTHLERKNSDRAQKLLRSFIQGNRSHEWVAVAWEKLGDAYMDLEQPGKAADAYQQSVQRARSPRAEVVARFKLGNAYQEIDNSRRALAEFEKVVEVGEKAGIYVRVPDSYYRIADHLYEQKKYRDALERYTRVTRKYPSYQETPWGLFQIANSYRGLKQYQEAVGAYQQLMAAHPEDYWARQAQWKKDDTLWEYEHQSVLR